jgi:histidine triad (HIT) family protein
MERECVFCKIIRGESPADFVYKGEEIVVFKDIRPEAPIHLLVVPRKHIPTVNDLTEEDRLLVGEMFLKARAIAQRLGIAERGYKLILNVERGGGQIIFHLHMHLLGGW